MLGCLLVDSRQTLPIQWAFQRWGIGMTGKELRELRIKLGIKQADSAYMALVSPRTWQAWETGTSRICLSGLQLWLIKAGVHPEFAKKGQSLPVDLTSDAQSLPVDLDAVLNLAMLGDLKQAG